MSALENRSKLKDSWLVSTNGKKVALKYNLISFYYARRNLDKAQYIRDNSELIYVDSGAHSFQKGIKVKWDKYIKDYCEFIKMFDRPNVLGFFELDIDKIIGLDKVLEIRKQLLNVNHKIIPVWHKNRGIEDYKKMCQEYSGKIVAISGFKNEDIRDEDFPYFVSVAKKYGTKIHCLGMGREKIMKQNNFYSVDCASWVNPLFYARYKGKKIDSTWMKSARNREKLEMNLYIDGMKIQKKVESWGI